MANAIYPLGRQKFANGELAWKSGGDTFSFGLVKTGYTYSASHEFMSDLSTYCIGGTGLNTYADMVTLANTVNALGVLDADDPSSSIIYENGGSHNSVIAIVIFKKVSTLANSPLVAYIDTATGLPITTNGAGIPIAWDNGANKIAKL